MGGGGRAQSEGSELSESFRTMLSRRRRCCWCELRLAGACINAPPPPPDVIAECSGTTSYPLDVTGTLVSGTFLFLMLYTSCVYSPLVCGGACTTADVTFCARDRDGGVRCSADDVTTAARGACDVTRLCGEPFDVIVRRASRERSRSCWLWCGSGWGGSERPLRPRDALTTKIFKI